MALKPCLECGKPVAESAWRCPYCNAAWPVKGAKKESLHMGLTVAGCVFAPVLAVLAFFWIAC